MQKGIFDFIEKKPKSVLIILWLIANSLWVCIFGMNTKLEGEKYIYQAQYFINNLKFTEQRHFFYCITIFIIAISKLLTGKVWLSFLILWLINVLAYLSFFNALRIFFNSSKLALAGCFALLFYFPFQSWTTYLYTENLFYSLVILYLAAILQLAKSITTRKLIVAILILMLLIFSRPLGILFVIPSVVFALLLTPKKHKWIIALTSIAFLLIIKYISNLVLSTTPDWTVQRSFMEENLICDVPTVDPLNNKLNLIKTGNPIEELLHYIINNFNHFINLALTRLKLFLLNTRNYYSTGHNLFLLGTLLPLYFITVFRLKSIRKLLGKAFFYFSVFVFLLFTAAVVAQCDDYHNRFFMTLMPIFVIFLAAAAKNYFFRKTA